MVKQDEAMNYVPLFKQIVYMQNFIHFEFF